MTDKEYIVGEDSYSYEMRRYEELEELIRCKDCKHWNEYYRECNSPNWDTGTDDCFVVPAGFYCGWAERNKSEEIIRNNGTYHVADRM